MKLHLPKLLRNAVLACVTAVVGLATTVGTAAFTGGVVAFTLAAPQALADYTWNGGSGTKTKEDWNNAANWELNGAAFAGSGPGTPNSNMWETIHLSGGTEALVIGAAATDSRVYLEGWQPKYSLEGNVTLYATTKKFQGTNSISVNNNSTLDLIHEGGHFEALTVNIGAGSEMILTVTNNKENGALTLNLNAADAMMTFASNNTDVRTLSGPITVTTKLGDIDAGTMSRQKLGLATQNVTLSNLSFNFGDEWVRTETEITEANYATLAGKYYIDIVDGEYYVVYSKAPACIWDGGDLSWGADTVFSNDLQFTDGTNVNFRGADAQVTLTADVQANFVSIAEGIKVGLKGNNTLTAETISLSENAQLSILKKSVLGGGLVKMADGAQLNIAVGGSTTIQDVLGDSVTWSGGAIGITNGTTIELADNKLNDSNVVVDGVGSCVNVTNSAATFNKNVKLQNSAVMELATDVGSDRFSWGSAQKIEVQSGSELKLNNSRVSVQAADQIILNNGKITGAGDANGALDFFQNGAVVVSDGTSSIEGPICLRNAGVTTTFQVNSGTLTVGAFTNNGGHLEKTGAGTMVISGAAGYSGSTTISAGELVLQGATNAGKGLLTIAENATLTIAEGANRTIVQTISGAGKLNLNGTLTINFAEYTVLRGAGMTYSDGENGYAPNLLVASMGQITKGENSSVVVINGEETNTYTSSDITITDGKMFVGFSGGASLYYVNTDVTYNAETMGGATEFYMTGNSIFRTADISVLTRTSSQNSTSNLYLDASGETLTAEAASAYSGNIIITAGTTVQAAEADSLGVNYANNKERSIVVENGATLEVGADTYYKVVLNEGATMANRTGQTKDDMAMQNPYIDLQGDATIDAQSTFGMRYAGADSTQSETLNLNGHTLTKTGAGDFFFFNTTINAGTIDVKEGLVDVKGGSGYASVDMRLQSGAALVASANDKGWKSLTLYSGETDGGTVEVRTNGTNQLTIHNGITADVLLDKKEGGNLVVNGTSALGAGVTISAGTLTLNGATSLGSVLTIESGATLAMGESGAITISSLSGFEGESTQNVVPTTNGLVEFASSYKIVDNKNANNANSNLTSVIYRGTSYELSAEGSVDIGGNIYYVVEGGEDKVVYVGGDSPTADTATATEFYVGEQGTLHIMGAASDDMAADRVLKSTSGTGTIKLSTNVELLDGSAIIHEGTLSIENNTTLTLGRNENNNRITYLVDLSTLESLDLNGGAIRVYYVAPTIQNMNVTAASTINVFDVKPGATTNINSLNLADDLRISTDWKSDVCIGVLSGEGNLNISQMYSSEQTISPLVINGFDNYGGTVTVSDQGGHKLALSLKINEGQSLRSEQLNVAGGNATAVLKGAGTYDLGSSLTLNPRVSLSDEWTGAVSASDVVVNSSVDTSALSNSNSTLEVSGLSVESSGLLTLGGRVVLDGSVSIAATVTNNAELTFGDNFKLSISEDMFVEGPDEGEYIINLFTGTNAGAVAGMNTGMLSAELLERGAESSWRFNEDGTIVFVAETKLVWAGGDGALNSNNYTGGKDYADDSSLTFGAVTDGTPDTVTVDEDAVLRSMKLLEGADYRFTGTGSLSINTSLSVGAGANVVIELADGVEAGQKVSSAGNLKVNKITGAANVDITGGSLELSGANALANTGSKTISGAELKGTWTASGVNLGTGVTVSGNVTLTDSFLAGTVTSTGALVLGGTINITPSANFETKVEGTQYSDGANGFKYDDVTYTVVSGSVSTAEDIIWQVDGVTAGNFAEGKLNVRGQQDGTYYWVREGSVTYSAGSMTGATAIALGGGNLALDAALADTLTEGIKVMAAGTVTVGASITLDAADLNVADATKKVTLEGAGNYAIGSGLELGTGVELGTGWNGTVQTEVDAITSDTTLALGDKVEFTADTVSLAGPLTTAGSLTMNDIRIGALSEVPLLNVGGILSADSVGIDTGLLANTKEGSWTLIQVGSVAGDLQLQNEGLTGLGVSNLYNYTLEWDADNTTLVLKGEINVDYVWGDDDESFGGGESPKWSNDANMEGADVVFGGSTASSSDEVKGQVTLDAGGEGAVKVNNVTITNLGSENEQSEYTFTGDDLASTGALNVSAGSTLNVQNNATFAEASQVTVDSSLNVNGGSLTVGTDDAAADLTVDGSLSVADKGSVAVMGNLTGEGSLSVSGAETSVTVGGDMEVSGTGSSVTVGEGSSLGVTGAMTTEGVLAVSKGGNLSVGADLDAKGALTMAGGAVLEVAGALKTDFITIEGELVDGQDVMVAVGELATDTEDSITLTLADDTLENLAVGTYDLLQVMGGMTDLVLDENIISTLFNRECKVSLATASAAGRTFGLRGAVPTIITLTVEAMTEDDKTWIVGNDKLGLNNDMFSVLGADGKLLSNSALDKALKIQINEAYELNLVDVADGDKTVHLNNLSGSGDFTVTGDGDTVAVSGTSYAGNLAINDVALVMDGLSAASLKGNEGADIAGSIKLTGSGSDYKGTYTNGAEVSIAGGKHTLVAGDGLTVAGSAGTAVLTGVGKANLATSGTDVQIAGPGVTLTGSMDGGTLAADITVTNHQIQALNLAAGSLDLSADTEVVLALGGDDMVLKLTNGALATLSTDSKADDASVKLQGKAVDKYFTGAYIEGGKVYADRNTSYYTDKVGTSVSANGAAGIALADAALVELNPQATAPAGALASVLNILDTASGAAADELGASLAGASTAVLGMAAMGDVDRQLKAIRNRTTSMGVDQSVANDDMPYFNAWINAEGDHTELSENGTESGYKLSSWGGTVGFDVDCCSTFTAGMALTAMYGDLDATGAASASGDLDTYYLSAFARYAPSAWTHTFVATVGMSDISLNRTVAGAEAKGETDGMSFGLMYEVGRVIALSEDGSTCLQPLFNIAWRHSTVDAYTEKGSDLALEVDEQSMDTVTLGLGARLQTVVGESVYNRTSILEARVLAKADLGDRGGSSDVSMTALKNGKTSVDSAEMGAVGLEAGAGLIVPVGQESGNIFADAAVELRSDYINVNATVGYRMNF